MTWLSGLIRKQGLLMLDNNRHAMLHAIALALLPYTAWLSLAIVALVTLRKGCREGGWLLVLVTFANFMLSAFSASASISLINALLTFMPGYLAACVLRLTVSWRAVAGLFFLQVLVAVLLLHLFVPEFIMAQYVYLQSVLREVQTDNALLAFINDKTVSNQLVLASYFLGLQAVGVVFSASLSLACARFIQSQFFYPGGFRQEMLNFRGDKIGLLLLIILFIATSQQNVLAMSLFPMLIFYFLLAGLSLIFNIFAKQKPLRTLILLVATIVLMPFVMLPVYVIFGSLDSLFNFRLYLPTDAGKTI